MPENARSLRPTLEPSKCQVSLTARMKGIRGQVLNLGEERMRMGRSETGGAQVFQNSAAVLHPPALGGNRHVDVTSRKDQDLLLHLEMIRSKDPSQWFVPGWRLPRYLEQPCEQPPDDTVGGQSSEGDNHPPPASPHHPLCFVDGLLLKDVLRGKGGDEIVKDASCKGKPGGTGSQQEDLRGLMVTAPILT